MAVQSLLCYVRQAVLIAALAFLVACGSSSQQFNGISETDLVGVWRAEYVDVSALDTAAKQIIQVTGVETLTLTIDGNYKQVYDDGHGYIYESDWQPWSLDSDKLVHLKRGRWYPSGIANAERYAQEGGISAVLRDKRIEVALDQEVLLTVFVEPRGEVILQHLPTLDPDSGGVTFHRVTSATPAPALTGAP
jgi:hypothetical protein